MIIQHNMLAMNNLIVGKQLQKSKTKNMERLSSGYRINRAADDAANMAISEKMHSRIRALARCQQNIEEGISLAQTADGALHEVNNMLNRAAELCVQAANDTNTTEDRSKIAAEITQIYDEMDRVFTTTEFNTMKIFRHDGDNYYGPEAEYLYHESVTELPPGELHNWGTGMFPTKQFNMAKEAVPATATLTLADGVDLSDVSSLNGTSFNIKKDGTTYKIQFGTARSTGSTYPETGYYINTNSYRSVSSAFQQVNDAYTFIDSVSISGNLVKFTFYTPEESKKITYKADTDGDGTRETIEAYETVKNGFRGNNISLYCEGNSLGTIGDSSSKIIYGTSASQNLKILGDIEDTVLLPPPNAGTADLTKYLKTLSENGLKLNNTVSIPLNTLQLPSNPTVGHLRQAIADAISQIDPAKFSATYDTTTKEINVVWTGLPDNTYTWTGISESPAPAQTLNGKDILSTLSVAIQTDNATSESLAKHTFTLPPLDDDTKLYALKVNDDNFLLYNENKYGDYSFSSDKYYTTYLNYNNQSLEENFLSILKREYDDAYTISVDWTTREFTLISKTLNNNTPLVIENNEPTYLTMEKKNELTLGISQPSYYKQNYSVTIDFTNSMTNGYDSSALIGKGFMLNNKYYQFYEDGKDYVKYNKDTIMINLKGSTSFEHLKAALSNATNLLVTDNSSGVLTLTGEIDTDSDGMSHYTNFSDGGPSGTFSTNAVSSGGTANKNPQAEIDFSHYDVDNLDELYGTGFRLTCASCPGEFVNVMFCHDKSELNYPKDFKYTDANGNTSVIHNYMVELKDVTHGSQIAAYIAEQLEKDLDHFTEVKVSDTNPSVLIAQDKRSADQPTGRGQVLAGVYTNFLYNVIPEKLPNLGDKVGGGRKDTDAYYAYCMIYAGDTKEKPYIPVHLPHFSVENLKLEYPKEPWDSYEEITDVMNRSRNAAEVVSMARSKIGADQNRLEHAFDYAANAEEQIAAANSRIEDTDMAEAVTTQAKLTILSNTQEAILSQIVDLPERILPLLQQ